MVQEDNFWQSSNEKYPYQTKTLSFGSTPDDADRFAKLLFHFLFSLDLCTYDDIDEFL